VILHVLAAGPWKDGEEAASADEIMCSGEHPRVPRWSEGKTFDCPFALGLSRHFRDQFDAT
jgi:hypothetical protein